MAISSESRRITSVITESEEAPVYEAAAEMEEEIAGSLYVSVIVGRSTIAREADSRSTAADEASVIHLATSAASSSSAAIHEYSEATSSS